MSPEEKAAKRAYDIARRPEYAERKKELRRTWRENEKKASQRRRADPSQWGTQVLPRIRHRAAKKGLECTIQGTDLVVPEFCPVFGFPLILGRYGHATGHPDGPSVDRFDNAKGYTPENVRVISNRANLLKKDATVEEIRMLLRYMESGS